MFDVFVAYHTDPGGQGWGWGGGQLKDTGLIGDLKGSRG